MATKLYVEKTCFSKREDESVRPATDSHTGGLAICIIEFQPILLFSVP